MHAELKALFAADQDDRKQGIPAADMIERDRVRRRRVKELIGGDEPMTAVDCLHAAFVFQHGEELGDYWTAHELAKKAIELGHPDERQAKWLAAASYDRWLTNQGKPQKYGTQFHGDQNGWRLMDYDPNTTDAERTLWGVPTLAELLRRGEELNRRFPVRKGEA